MDKVMNFHTKSPGQNFSRGNSLLILLSVN